jgi:hypothetical protein
VWRCLPDLSARPRLAAAGIETRSIDEMTGLQALERVAPTQPIRPARPERTEFEHIRHGTTTLIAGFDVATAEVGYRVGQTRTRKTSCTIAPPCVQAARATPFGIR